MLGPGPDGMDVQGLQVVWPPPDRQISLTVAR